jgi:glycine/D-amino acid oxidase-like deaminating enzyme
MADRTADIIVAGAGIFGMSSALALRAHGHQVTVLDPGPIPHPLAASTDISKAVRMDYGPDEDYMVLGEQALAGWRHWNADWGEDLYHEVGVMFVSRAPLQPGGFEYESYRLLQAHGHRVERLDSAAIADRFPAWTADPYVDGYFNPAGGYAEAGRVVAALAERAARQGIDLHPGQAARDILIDKGRVTGVRTATGDTFQAGTVVVAAGVWTPLLVPNLAPAMKASGQPVFHLKPADPAPFEANRFPVFGADISQTGWYGFPLHPRERVVKIANHGPGLTLHPDEERVVTQADAAGLRDFLRGTFPALADAEIVYTRLCLYIDTFDEHFWIDRHPETAGLVVASGGSGHGFKFAPVLGDLVADVVEGKPHPYVAKFGWRQTSGVFRGDEAARFHDDE